MAKYRLPEKGTLSFHNKKSASAVQQQLPFKKKVLAILSPELLIFPLAVMASRFASKALFTSQRGLAAQAATAKKTSSSAKVIFKVKPAKSFAKIDFFFNRQPNCQVV